MYIQYFGLKESPFALPPDPRYLYLSRRHQEALAHLMYSINEGGGFAQLSGEVGTGKTLLIRALLERLPKHIDAALVLYPFLSVREFLASICDDLRVPYDRNGASLKALIDSLNGFLLENHAKGRRTVLIVDEAHKLNREVLEQIRLLTNLETTKEKLLQIVLVGQPELDSLLAQPDLRQLAQRITSRYSLKALLPKETTEYIRHRCRVAGARGPLFSPRALQTAHRVTHGIPRMINVICDRALLGAYARGKAMVTPSIVRMAMSEIGVELKLARLLAWRPWALGAGGAVAAGLIAVGLWYVTATPPVPEAPAPVASVEEPKAPGPKIETAPLAGKEGEGGETAATAEVAAPVGPGLDTLLADGAIRTDTDTAFSALFALWQLDYTRYRGATGCERALGAGLRCLYESGTWNNLRQLNRPAVIELVDAQGDRHHVPLLVLTDDRVVLELAGKRREFTQAEVDRYWFGKYLALWNPPEATMPRDLRRGMRGPLVLWVREMLSRSGNPAVELISDVYDAKLEAQVKEFQRQHRLDDDGVIGKMTWVQLSTHDERFTPPVLSGPAPQAVSELKMR
jgi:general secretion pathway protein A